MRRKTRSLTLAAGIVTGVLAIAPAAQAQWAVFDAASFAQLLQQVTYWQQQIQGMQQQLNQLNQSYNAITGVRGMQSLLPLTAQARNYLPTNWSQLQGVMTAANGSYGGLGTVQSRLVQSHAILSPAAIAILSPAQQQQLTDRRNTAALLQTVTQTALSQVSSRFTTLQGLITQIGVAQDAKAIADLQGRIQAEQAMLATDQTKLDTLYQAVKAQQLINDQRAAENAVATIGHASALPVVHY